MGKNIKGIADVKPMHSMNDVRYTKPVRAADDIKYLTVDEQESRLLARRTTQVLQQLLEHASIKTTMDRYVHVTDDSLVNAIRQFERAASAIYEKRA